MNEYSLSDLRTKLTEVLKAIEAGEDIIITRRGERIALILPYSEDTAPLSKVHVRSVDHPAQRPADRPAEISEPTLAQVKAKDAGQRAILAKMNRKPKW
jgi:prevent-host-death family protein